MACHCIYVHVLYIKLSQKKMVYKMHESNDNQFHNLVLIDEKTRRSYNK